MTKVKWAALAATAMMAAGVGMAPARAQGQPAPLLFDDFLFDNLGQPGQNLNNFLQWDVVDGSVDLLGGNLPGAPFAPPANPQGRYVDLGGSTGNPGLFRTKLAYPVTSATSYTLNFDYRSDTPGQINAASVFVGDLRFDFSTSSEAFETFSRIFTFDPLLTSVFVAFQGFEGDADGSGVGIDRVMFGPTLIPAAVPEPAAWGLMVAGVGAVGAALRRRRTVGGRATATVCSRARLCASTSSRTRADDA